MLTKLSHTEYDCFDTVSSETMECPVDIEYSLPDYCPDVQKILKCIPYPEISSYSFTQDKLMCEGRLMLHVQYMDGKSGAIRVCEISKEYSLTREITGSGDRAMGKLSASCGHIVCRALSARKLDIHIPVILSASVIAHKHDRLACDVEGLEKKMETINISHGVNAISHQFVIEQEMELSQGCPPIESVLRKNSAISGLKCSCGAGKIQIEGLAELALVYRGFAESLSVEKMNYTLPFTQTIDAAGAEPECIASFDAYICECTLQPKEDSMGECTVCSLYMKIDLYICMYMEKEVNLIVDAYSTGGHCDMKYQNASLVHYDGRHEEKLNYTKSIFLSEDELEKLLDIWCEEVSAVPYCEKNKINYRGKFNVCLVYLGKSKQIFSVTKTYDFTITREFQDIAQRRSESSVRMTIKDFRIVDGNNIEVNCEGMLISQDFSSQQKRILVNAELSQEDSPGSDKVVVYYSQKDEELWEIGKRYSAAVGSIVENNSLQESMRSPGGPLAIF